MKTVACTSCGHDLVDHIEGLGDSGIRTMVRCRVVSTPGGRCPCETFAAPPARAWWRALLALVRRLVGR